MEAGSWSNSPSSFRGSRRWREGLGLAQRRWGCTLRSAGLLGVDIWVPSLRMGFPSQSLSLNNTVVLSKRSPQSCLCVDLSTLEAEIARSFQFQLRHGHPTPVHRGNCNSSRGRDVMSCTHAHDKVSFVCYLLLNVKNYTTSRALMLMCALLWRAGVELQLWALPVAGSPKQEKLHFPVAFASRLGNCRLSESRDLRLNMAFFVGSLLGPAGGSNPAPG
ncbi:39S ribosomal protein L34, mitochondrial isoform X1 [Nycticebus coucang]|uniref:39S ribosomal protein L34, mitochondrial isoform X1 n=1 Tax=Nycticebus coucang TaxID=9470 RepID=UPI00234C8E0D|nr:39S ribosomal protein L34, mitochondrial isoform X1 [Nycticebus coucang]